MTPELAGGQSPIYQLALFVASFCFLIGLRLLTNAETARRGQQLAVIGMFVAVVGTLTSSHIVTYQWIVVGLVVGTAIGVPMGLWIPMTKMPERIALSHSFGGLAVALVGVSEYHVSQQLHGPLGTFALAAVGFEVVVGAITFSGSLIAFAKLQGVMTGKPIVFFGQNVFNLVLLVATVTALGLVLFDPQRQEVFYALVGAGVVLGVIGVIRIGGADMPVVICLLNSYAGLAASASGFALDNNVLIICGALDGGSGLILALIMSRAMNRSFANVMFGAFGSDSAATAAAGGIVREGTVEDAAELLKLAQSVIVVPGYGMAVAQAQHAVRDLASTLAAEGCQVRYAIHPVAGRMPGHMNVLLAEADVPYDQLCELEAINDDFPRTDVVLVVGANDVVNPAARTTPDSPIFGMPILNADQARAVIVLKRSMNPGFSGIENELFVLPRTMMVFGDAKAVLGRIVTALRGAH
jgi:NAD(P) transhydrogenase subunit beta